MRIRFKNFSIENIGTERHPCVQIYLKSSYDTGNNAKRSNIKAWGNWVLGPQFKDTKEQDNYWIVKELIKDALDKTCQIRFVLEFEE